MKINKMKIMAFPLSLQTTSPAPFIRSQGLWTVEIYLLSSIYLCIRLFIGFFFFQPRDPT